MGTKAAWTEARRQRQSEIIRRTKPWEHSTGPRTEAGKQVSSRNAISIWVARRRALEAVTKNLLAQAWLYTEVLGLKEGGLSAHPNGKIDFRKATEDQQDRYIDLLWDEIDLKAEFFALWPDDLNYEQDCKLEDLDWSEWSGDLVYECEFNRDFGYGRNHENDNDGRREEGSPRFGSITKAG